LVFQVSFEVGPFSGLEIRAIWWVKKEERHSLSIRTGRWSELSAEDEVRYTGNERLRVNTMSKASGVTVGLYGLVVGVFGPKIRQ
jgi:hypothetical protein